MTGLNEKFNRFWEEDEEDEKDEEYLPFNHRRSVSPTPVVPKKATRPQTILLTQIVVPFSVVAGDEEKIVLVPTEYYYSTSRYNGEIRHVSQWEKEANASFSITHYEFDGKRISRGSDEGKALIEYYENSMQFLHQELNKPPAVEPVETKSSGVNNFLPVLLFLVLILQMVELWI